MAFVVVNAQVVVDSSGARKMLPALLTPDGPLFPLLDYCLSVRRSISWQNKLVRAVKLFLEYLEANSIESEDEWRQFRNFSNALRNGTMGHGSLVDPSKLYWSPVNARTANQLVCSLSEFFDWLARNDRERAARFNPLYGSGAYDQRVDRKAYQFRRSKAFLGHAWTSEPSRPGRLVRGERPPKVFAATPPAFPEDRIEELLFKGFKVGGRYDFRGMAITCLLFGGGLRVSEPFHIYMADVKPHWSDSSTAFVAVHHPTLGIAPSKWTNPSGQRGNRDEYLRIQYGLTARNLIRGKHHAGWKNPALDDRYFMQVHWFPKVLYGRLFLQIWKRYLERAAHIDRSHPYAWINLDRAPVGGIYTISAYLRALQAAVERIGLVYGKVHGTTAHGPRHAYGQRARRAEINEVIVQRLMHHCSPESQRVYTQPEAKEVTAVLDQASEKLASKASTAFSSTVLLPSI